MTGRSRWGIVFAFSFVVASTQLLWVTFMPITTSTAQLLHVSESDIGWLSEVFPLVYVVLAIPFGKLTDRWFRGSLILGAVLTAAGALIRLNPDYSAILIAQIVVSIGQPLVLNAINKISAVYVIPERRPTAIAIGSASMFLGILLAMLSGPLLLESFGLNAVLWSQSIFTLCGIALFLVLLFNEKALYPVEAEMKASIKKVWKDPVVRKLCILLFLGFGLFITISTWLQVLVEDKGINSVEVGTALALMTAAGIVGSGIIPDWALRTGKSRSMILLSLLCSGITLLFLFIAQPYWLLVLLLIGTGFLILADLPICLSTQEMRSPPSEIGTATSLLLLFGNAGGIILALLVQFFIAQSFIPILILLAAVLVAFPVAMRFPDVRSDRTRSAQENVDV
jgi:predicted MFS family arabinose efflux permease